MTSSCPLWNFIQGPLSSEKDRVRGWGCLNNVIFLSWAHLTPVAHRPVRWTQDVSVTGNEGPGLQQVQAVSRWESLFIRSHGLDAQHGSLLHSIWATCGGTRFPFPCPPSVRRYGDKIGGHPKHICIQSSYCKDNTAALITELEVSRRCFSPPGRILQTRSSESFNIARAQQSTWPKQLPNKWDFELVNVCISTIHIYSLFNQENFLSICLLCNKFQPHFLIN